MPSARSEAWGWLGTATREAGSGWGAAVWSVYRMRPTAHGGSRKGVDYPGEPTLNLGGGGRGASAESGMVEMLVHKKPLD